MLPRPFHHPSSQWVVWFVSLLQYKVWVKPGSEQSFLYGNHILKSGLGRITESTTQYQGVVVYSMADVPLVSDGVRAGQGIEWADGVAKSLITGLTLGRALEWQPNPRRSAGRWTPWRLWCSTRQTLGSTFGTRRR